MRVVTPVRWRASYDGHGGVGAGPFVWLGAIGARQPPALARSSASDRPAPRSRSPQGGGASTVGRRSGVENDGWPHCDCRGLGLRCSTCIGFGRGGAHNRTGSAATACDANRRARRPTARGTATSAKLGRSGGEAVAWLFLLLLSWSAVVGRSSRLAMLVLPSAGPSGPGSGEGGQDMMILGHAAHGVAYPHLHPLVSCDGDVAVKPWLTDKAFQLLLAPVERLLDGLPGQHSAHLVLFCPLPPHRLTEETLEVVRLGTGMLPVLPSLVLRLLLIAPAKSSPSAIALGVAWTNYPPGTRDFSRCR